MAEVHIIGEIAEATDFSDQSLFAKWTLNAGPCWRALEGFTDGQTQLTNKLEVEVEEEDDSRCVIHPWSHPIDVHYATKGLQGWPRMDFQVWGVNWLGRCNICAYGFINMPSKAGYHELECHTWRPVGDFRRRFIDYVTGQRIHLIDPSDIIGAGLNRHIIQSESMGTIRVKLTVVLKDFQEFGVDL
jgi:B9 domain-containing protein 2